MRKRFFHILNWDKYQARTDKDLPWCKLWGTIFDRPWFQNMPDSGKYLTFVLMDLARKSGNRIGEEYVFIEYLRGNYGILSTKNEVFNHLKVLSDNEFLSDNTSALQDKIREDKIREDKIRIDSTPVIKNKIPPDLDAVKDLFKNDIMASDFFDYYQSNGWRVGKNPMKDWVASARRWARMNHSKPTQDKHYTKNQTHVATAIEKMENRHEVRHIQKADTDSILRIPQQEN